MKQEISLYYSRSTTENYYVGHPICDYCKKSINFFVIFKIAWGRKNPMDRIACKDCLERGDTDIAFKAHTHKLSEVKAAIVLDHFYELPPDAQPVFPVKPDLMCFRGDTVIDAAYRESEQTIDHTRLSGRESWEGSMIGNPDMKRIEDLDTPIEGNKILPGLDVLDEIEMAKPLDDLKEQEKRYLERKKKQEELNQLMDKYNKKKLEDKNGTKKDKVQRLKHSA